ncbi:MAG: hypothetical protein FWH27_03805 [Planctomycetaceae bacterium]|nr:hypothetical protein [Planctomycetaceae bacterium]
MRNHQILIDEIRGTFASDELISPDLYRSLAEDYAKACKDMIGRLKACVAYLRSGNTAEAVRLADVEPNLFDIYNLLDFPEREEWVCVLESFGYKLPPPFPKELARQLNDAYCQSASLEPLQKRYRVLAIERAPLAERLQVLRSIAAADPINPSWRKDLEAFEEERLKELGHDIDRAVADNNYAGMRKLQKEISQNWCVPVPAYLRDKLNVKLRGIHFQSLNKRLEELVGQLQEAYDDRDIEKGQSLVDEIREIVGESGMAIPAELSDKAEEAVRWLNDEKKRRKLLARYEATLRQLKSELHGETSTNELARTHSALSLAAQMISQPIPELLEEEYLAVIRSREQQSKHKRHVNIAMAAVGLALLVTTMVAAVTWLREKQQADRIIAELLEKVESDVLPSDAETFQKNLEANHAGLLKRQDIEKLNAELLQRIVADGKRRSLFDEYYQLAKNSTAEGKTPDVLAWQQAEKLALRDDEQTQINAMRPFFEKYIAETQRQVDGKVETELARLSRDAMTVQRDQGVTFRDRQDKLRTIATDLESLSRMPGLSAGLVQRVKRATANVTQAIQNLEAERGQSERLDVLLAGVGNAESFVKALNAYTEQFPQNSESADFCEVVAMSEIWGSLLHTETFRQALAGVIGPDATDETAARALDLYTRRYAGIRNFATEDFVKYGVPYLETVALRTSDPLAERKPFENIKATLRVLSQRELWTIYASSESPWYYVLREPAGRGSYPCVKSIYAQTSTRSFDDSYFAAVPKVNPYNYAIDALRKLDNITPAQWSEICYTLTQKLFEADGIDPILKVVLLKQMIADFAKCDSVFAERFQQMAALLDDDTPNFDDAPNWMDGETILNDPMRAKCRSILARITFPTTEEMQIARDRVNACLVELQREYHWIGFALRRDERWTLMAKNSPLPPGTLYVVRPLDSITGFRCELDACGQIDPDGTVALTVETLARQGEPVFVKK